MMDENASPEIDLCDKKDNNMVSDSIGDISSSSNCNGSNIDAKKSSKCDDHRQQMDQTDKCDTISASLGAIMVDAPRQLLRKCTKPHFRPQFAPLTKRRRSPTRPNSLTASLPNAKRQETDLVDAPREEKSASESSESSSYSDVEEHSEGNQGSDQMSSNQSSGSEDEDVVSSFDEIEVSDWLIDDPNDTNQASNDAEGQQSSETLSQVSYHTAYGSDSNFELERTRSSKGLEQISNWLNATHASPSPANEGIEDLEDDFESHLTPFMRDNMPIYKVMRQVQLFRNLSQKQQEQVLCSLKPAKFLDGQVIVQQGARGDRFYMIAKGSAVITKTMPGSKQERMITHLYPGHYFGELALIYDDPRTATVWAVGDVELLYLTQNDFQRIGHVHLSLMLQQVPLLARLNSRDQDIVLSRLQPTNFADGEYIVRQGEEGTRFYIITKGEAAVTERDLLVAESTEKELTRLYEGHVFGEMSLIYKEPRTASVRAIGPVKCLYLTAEDFEQCLTSDHFQRFVQEEYVEKARKRAMRLRLQKEQQTIVQAAAAVVEQLGQEPEGQSHPEAFCDKADEATETRTLVKQRLANGQKVVNEYVIQGDLGKGTYGRVKLCQNEQDNKLYAVKILHKSFVSRMAGKEDLLRDALRREIAIMKKLQHRNVVRLVEVIDDPSSAKIYLVQEYVKHNLMDQIAIMRGLTEQVARRYLRDLLLGLHYLHLHRVIHRDIKPGNILVSAEGVAKIADFGTARMIMNESETLSGAKGTPAFMAPEMFDIDATYRGPSVDIWSLGATLYMMVIGHPPWLADNEIVLSEKVQKDELCFPSEAETSVDPHLKNLLQRMLTKDPKLRISLPGCFKHEWVTKEGSEPLVPNTNADGMENSLMSVSLDESELAIRNIPEHIDQSLSESLMKAHMLIKNGLLRSVSGNQSTESKKSGFGSGTFRAKSLLSSGRPSFSISDDGTSLIGAWRQHKRIQLMEGHTNLSEKSKDLLLEQKRMAVSVDRAMVSELILPANALPSSSVSPHGAFSNSNDSIAGQETEKGLPESRRLLTKSSFLDTSRMHESPANLQPEWSASTSNSMQSRSSSESKLSATTIETDEKLMKRSLSRKKDFLMVTSEVFRDQDGDYQSRKILFQARDHDFSVASRAPIPSIATLDALGGSNAGLSSTSTREGARSLLTTSSASKKLHILRHKIKDSHERESSSSISSFGSSFQQNSSSEQSLLSREDKVLSEISKEIDLEGLEVTHIEDEEDELMKSPAGSGKSYENQMESLGSDSDDVNQSDDSDYSDVQDDVDVDQTFEELIGAPNSMELVLEEDEELAPLRGHSRNSSSSASLLAFPANSSLLHCDPSIVQVYVSSKIRENLLLGIRTGYAEARGSRAFMEDKSAVIAACGMDAYPSSVSEKYESMAFFGVFDGHNGDDTAMTLQSKLLDQIISHPAFAKQPKKAIHDSCLRLDSEILHTQNQRWQPGRSSSQADDTGFNDGCTYGQTLQPISFSGSAAVFAILVKEQRDDQMMESCRLEGDLMHVSGVTKVHVGNIGDCRAVLSSKDGLALEITRDHKASNPAEKERVEKSGGFVHNGRLDGILAISRGFGDLAHKQDGHLIATPDVYEHVVTPEDEFLLLASDGLFDVLTSQQAVNFIAKKLRMHGDVQLAAQELLLKAQQYFSHDNTSVIIIAFNQIEA
uniref:cGMP-dependent protein kinase n=1 Tax=Albugo laibachii Nc14 TaxID=890382 RepID=F0WLC1_9STRA|nr:calcium/calmodulindependent protein kinase kinase pu [Albugo laibachii Nc14]|eukprot:CCA22084.1 calcium/calmodulindependent protein kinase kinase pu [Albugo laibachii Nc14]